MNEETKQQEQKGNGVLPCVSGCLSDNEIDEIIYSLDSYARDYDHYEYGLPTYDDKMIEMRQIVRTFLNNR